MSTDISINQEFRKRITTIFLTIIFSFFYSISKYYFPKLGIIQRLTGTSGHIVMILFWSSMQLLVLLSYFKYFIHWYILKRILVAYFTILFLDILTGSLYVLDLIMPVSKICFNSISLFLSLISTGLISLISALVYRRFKHALPQNISTTSQDNHAPPDIIYNPRSTTYKNSLLLLAIAFSFLSISLIFIDEYKSSGLAFWAAFIIAGTRERWNIQRFRHWPSYLTWLIIAFSSFIGFYGSLWDWFTGFMFYTVNVVLLTITQSAHNFSLMRWTILIISALFCLLFHFIFSVYLFKQ